MQDLINAFVAKLSLLVGEELQAPTPGGFCSMRVKGCHIMFSLATDAETRTKRWLRVRVGDLRSKSYYRHVLVDGREWTAKDEKGARRVAGEAFKLVQIQAPIRAENVAAWEAVQAKEAAAKARLDAVLQQLKTLGIEATGVDPEKIGAVEALLASI